MGQNSSRQQRPSINSTASASSTTAPDSQPLSQPGAATEPGPTWRRSVRNSLLNLVRPPAPTVKRPRKSRSWRSSRRWSKTPELVDQEQPLESSSSSSSSSSSATLPLGPIDEKAERGERQSLDHMESHDLQGEMSSSPASSSEQSSPAVSVPISEATAIDDNASAVNLDVPEAPALPVATPDSSTENTGGSAATANTPPEHQFPPPGTLVVVQGVVHTTDVPRPSTHSLQVPEASPRSSSTPPSTRSRLSTLLHSRPSSRMSSAPSSTTLDTSPTSDDPTLPPPALEPASSASDAESGPISSGSIDVLGTLLSVAAAATAASLLTGASEPLHLPSNVGNLPSDPSTPRPTSPTPTSGLDATRAERLRQAWGGIRERLGLRPHSTATPSLPSNSGTDSPSDPRDHLFGQMARAFNLGLGLSSENASVGSRDTPATSNNSQGTNDSTNTTGVTPTEPPAEGSFERFLLDLQTDLRAALSPPHVPTDVTPTTNPTEPETETSALESESGTEDAQSSHEDDDDDRYGMPPLGEVSDSDSESDFGNTSEDAHEEAPSTSTTSNTARASLPDVDAQGRINWWRLYRFAPITIPPNAQPGQGIPTALLPNPQNASASVHPQTPPQPIAAPPPLPLDPTLSELPFFDDVPDAPQSHTQTQVQTVVPVIVVGVQSVIAGGWPQATNTANNNTENARTSTPEEPMPQHAPDITQTEGNRGRGWHSRAAEAFRNLRPGRRNRASAPTNPGSRTFLIYVIGGYYPPNHSILNGGPETLASLEALLELADLLGHSKPPTVTKEDIEKSGLETIKATQLEQYEREDKISSNCIERCLICLDDYQSEDDIRVMKCRHAFHQGCVDKWLETGRNNCPACRSKGVSLDGTTMPSD